MLTLTELQSHVREAVVAVPPRALLEEIVSDRIPARERIRVYRNHFRVSLKVGLAQVFPATRILLGERYFDAMAALFIATRPPSDPRIGEYGDAFPRFLLTRDELEGLPYAAEVARLEWALTRIESAPDAKALDVARYERAVAELGGGFTLRLSRAATLFECEWPVNRIRASVLAGGGAEAVVALIADALPVRLLLHRDADGDACELALDDAAYAALCALRAGRPVSEAVRAALAVRAGCPVADLILFLFQAGLVAGLESTHVSRRGTAKEI